MYYRLVHYSYELQIHQTLPSKNESIDCQQFLPHLIIITYYDKVCTVTYYKI